MGVKQGVDALINIIEKDDEVSFRKKAAETLGRFNDPNGNDVLFNLFKSENRESREIAFAGISALDRSAGKKYVEDIIFALGDESENIRRSAADHLGDRFFELYHVDGKLDQRLTEVLLPLLNDKSAAVRESAARAFRGNSEQKIVEYLLPLLKDPSPAVREQTAYALGGSGNPLVIDPLISAAQDEDNWKVRDAIGQSIGSKWPKDRRVMEFLLSERKSFLNDEYGIVYWESKEWGSKEHRLYNWQFKTKNKFTAIEIVFVDQDGKQEILVDNKTMNNFPLEFRFCLSDLNLLGNLENPDLSVSLRYLRTEDQGRSYSIDTSYRQKFQGNKLKNVVYNKINSLEDQFNQSGEIALATYTTFDDPSTQTPPMGVVFPQDFARDGEENGTAGMPAGLHVHEFTSTIKIKYEIQQE
ncbi:MAG: HEAT repeat domain-containing protein, partial [Nitrospirota bacterium]